MEIDAVTFRTIARSLLPRGTTLEPKEAAAIVQIAELTTGADLDEDGDERRLLEQIARHVCAIGEISRDRVPTVSPLPLDAEERTAWIQRLASQLASPGARELAYVISYLLTVGDHELAPVEATLIDELQQALGITDDRASDLVASVSAQVTPDEEPELELEYEHEHRSSPAR